MLKPLRAIRNMIGSMRLADRAEAGVLDDADDGRRDQAEFVQASSPAPIDLPTACCGIAEAEPLRRQLVDHDVGRRARRTPAPPDCRSGKGVVESSIAALSDEIAAGEQLHAHRLEEIVVDRVDCRG